ncbi:hypothetical protein D3C81_1971440 [compost metagenome]
MTIQGNTAIAVACISQGVRNDPDNRAFCPKITAKLCNRHPCHNRNDCSSGCSMLLYKLAQYSQIILRTNGNYNNGSCRQAMLL